MTQDEMQTHPNKKWRHIISCNMHEIEILGWLIGRSNQMKFVMTYSSDDAPKYHIYMIEPHDNREECEKMCIELRCYAKGFLDGIQVREYGEKANDTG